jgi:hypothetical protein
VLSVEIIIKLGDFEAIGMAWVRVALWRNARYNAVWQKRSEALEKENRGVRTDPRTFCTTPDRIHLSHFQNSFILGTVVAFSPNAD